MQCALVGKRGCGKLLFLSFSPGSLFIDPASGDFLAPYLLSSIDRGAGMMNAIAKTPIDYLTWGNHEADIDHFTLCKHVRCTSNNLQL
jgi:hypothetical protein